MINMDKKTFEELAEFHEPHCTSIYIPTHRAGQEVNKGLDKKLFKNSLKKVKEELKHVYQMSEPEINDYLAPASELLSKSDFWNYQSDGLAVFIGKDFFRHFTLPVHFEEYYYVADHFYLKPLLPLLNEEANFYILALSLHDVRLYEGHPHQIDELVVDDLLPERLEEAVGFDYRQKYLQFREGQSGTDKTIFHGHGEGKDEKKEEVLKYFRAVNNGVMQVLHDKKSPLIIAAVDYLIPIYREANEYNHLHNEHIQGNPEHSDPVLLHEKAMNILSDYFAKDQKVKIKTFERELSNKKASFEAKEIIPAALNGRVDTLFIRNRSSLWGTFEKDTNSINKEDQKTPHNADLLNTAAINTLMQSGKVFLLEKEEMPEPGSLVNAIYRY